MSAVQRWNKKKDGRAASAPHKPETSDVRAIVHVQRAESWVSRTKGRGCLAEGR